MSFCFNIVLARTNNKLLRKSRFGALFIVVFGSLPSTPQRGVD